MSEVIEKFLTEDYGVVAPGGCLTRFTLRDALRRGCDIEPILVLFANRVRSEQKGLDAQTCITATADSKDGRTCAAAILRGK